MGFRTPPLHLFSLVPRPLFTPSAIHPFLSPWLCAIRQGLPCVKPPHACGGGCLDLEGLAYFEICKTGGSYLERPLLITGSATKGLPLPQHALVWGGRWRLLWGKISVCMYACDCVTNPSADYSFSFRLYSTAAVSNALFSRLLFDAPRWVK